MNEAYAKELQDRVFKLETLLEQAKDALESMGHQGNYNDTEPRECKACAVVTEIQQMLKRPSH